MTSRTDYYNDPPEDQEPPECCGEIMDIDGRVCVCGICGRRTAEPFDDIELPDNDDFLCRCDNCAHTANYSTLVPAVGLSQRLTVGGIHTDVECPVCGALCYPVDCAADRPWIAALRECITQEGACAMVHHPKKFAKRRLRAINQIARNAIRTLTGGDA